MEIYSEITNNCISTYLRWLYSKSKFIYHIWIKLFKQWTTKNEAVSKKLEMTAELHINHYRYFILFHKNV